MCWRGRRHCRVFGVGFLGFGLLPLLRREYGRYPAMSRTQEDIKLAMPFGILAMFVAILVLAAIVALAYQAGFRNCRADRFGALVGVFEVRAFVIYNHVNLKIGLAFTLGQALFISSSGQSWVACSVSSTSPCDRRPLRYFSRRAIVKFGPTNPSPQSDRRDDSGAPTLMA